MIGVCGSTRLTSLLRSPLSWHYSLQPEVFALNNLFCLVLLRLLQLFLNDNPALSRKPPSTRSRATLASRIDNFPMPFRLKYAALGAFVCGLGMCNQQYGHRSLALLDPTGHHYIFPELL